MKTFNFSANWVDFGTWVAQTEIEAKDKFAFDAGYKNWVDMVERVEEIGGIQVQYKEVST
jgi:hypothetical protein